VGADLRTTGTGTATPTNLHRVAGLRLALLAGVLEMGKGVIGPLLIGRQHLVLAAVAGALAVVGHNWSPFLRGAGGRGISTVTGALWVVAWPGAVFMTLALLLGVYSARSHDVADRAHAVLPAMRVAVFALIPFLWLISGLQGLIVGAILVAPVGFKTVHEIFRRDLLRRYGLIRSGPRR
jgi:glycerol-3-phosphate acyltransferase PlsY